MNKVQNGFTLMELVVVITILGLLAAFAVPRFAALEGEGRVAATQALAGSVRSGASLAHALWRAEGNPASASVTMDGQPITLEFGYPDAATIADTLVEYAGFALTIQSGTAVFTKTSSSGAPIANCSVTYTPPSDADDAPEVAATTNGC